MCTSSDLYFSIIVMILKLNTLRVKLVTLRNGSCKSISDAVNIFNFVSYSLIYLNEVIRELTLYYLLYQNKAVESTATGS